jgi:hypothetical protein
VSGKDIPIYMYTYMYIHMYKLSLRFGGETSTYFYNYVYIHIYIAHWAGGKGTGICLIKNSNGGFISSGMWAPYYYDDNDIRNLYIYVMYK